MSTPSFPPLGSSQQKEIDWRMFFDNPTVVQEESPSARSAAVTQTDSPAIDPHVEVQHKAWTHLENHQYSMATAYLRNNKDHFPPDVIARFQGTLEAKVQQSIDIGNLAAALEGIFALYQMSYPQKTNVDTIAEKLANAFIKHHQPFSAFHVLQLVEQKSFSIDFQWNVLIQLAILQNDIPTLLSILSKYRNTLSATPQNIQVVVAVLRALTQIYHEMGDQRLSAAYKQELARLEEASTARP
ncbi:MAG: hypothetical protein S4CHLAM102_14640 [Chlamydiia bacterium]|nr:hypothetical protein [Chlamydiia bacterium]